MPLSISDDWIVLTGVRRRFFLRAVAKKFDTPEFLLYTLCFVGASTSLVVAVAGARKVLSRSSKQLEGSSLPEQSKTEWKRGAAGYGTPVPQKPSKPLRIEARSVVLPSGVRAELLAGLSGFAVHLSA